VPRLSKVNAKVPYEQKADDQQSNTMSCITQIPAFVVRLPCPATLDHSQPECHPAQRRLFQAALKVRRSYITTAQRLRNILFEQPTICLQQFGRLLVERIFRIWFLNGKRQRNDTVKCYISAYNSTAMYQTTIIAHERMYKLYNSVFTRDT